MINFLHKHLAPGASEDDIVLEIVIFIGTCIQDPKCAPIFANSNLVNSLYDLMADKQEDDEIVLQITYTLYRCLQHESTRVILLEQTQVVSYFVDLLYDKNGEIRRMADQTLDLVMEFDQVRFPATFSLCSEVPQIPSLSELPRADFASQEWAQQIRLRKFQIYNSEWVQAVEREDGDDFVGSNLRGRMAIDDDMDEDEDDEYHGVIGGGNKYGMKVQVRSRIRAGWGGRNSVDVQVKSEVERPRRRALHGCAEVGFWF